MSPRRKTLATFGEYGRRVRVLVDHGRDRVLVQWFEQGSARKRAFPDTPAGRREAREYAGGVADELAHLDPARPRTMRALWRAYQAARFPDLRPKTRLNYAERWRQWELFVGAETSPEAVTLHHLDKLKARRREIGGSANQTRAIITVAKVVFGWARSRKLILTNDLAGYRWDTAKGEEARSIPEHSPEEYQKILAALDPENPHQWRLWCLLKVTGIQGARIRSARYLRWEDVGDGAITWPAEYMKQGKAFVQPVTADVTAALEVARRWRERDGYEGPFVFYAVRKSNAEPVYTYQSAWIALRKAETRAGVIHQPFRAFHGFRRHAAGNAYELTKDELAAAEWIGDKDAKQMRSYLKRRDERLRSVAEKMEEK
jgi:hypothetical protein